MGVCARRQKTNRRVPRRRKKIQNGCEGGGEGRGGGKGETQVQRARRRAGASESLDGHLGKRVTAPKRHAFACGRGGERRGKEKRVQRERRATHGPAAGNRWPAKIAARVVLRRAGGDCARAPPLSHRRGAQHSENSQQQFCPVSPRRRAAENRRGGRSAAGGGGGGEGRGAPKIQGIAVFAGQCAVFRSRVPWITWSR